MEKSQNETTSLDTVDISQFTNEEVVAIDMAQMDQLVSEYRKAREEYEDKKAASNEAHEVFRQKEKLVQDALNASGKSKYFVDGLGTVSVVSSMVVTTPKTIEEKRQLFSYIREKHGDDALMAYLSINYQSLNSFVKVEMDVHKEDPLFTVPGVGTPKSEQNVRFMAAKVKKT